MDYKTIYSKYSKTINEDLNLVEDKNNKNLTNPNNIKKDRTNSHHTKNIKNVLLIYTGGTFGMCKTENGYKPRKDFLFEYMKNHPVLCDQQYTLKHTNKDFNKEGFLTTPSSEICNRVNYKIYEFENAIDSSNMNMNYWIKIGNSIKSHYDDYDSFIVIHGTDTLAYTACILSFMLENLNKLVIVTGAQIPLIEMRNDSLKNLVDSLIIAGNYYIPEVCTFFNSKLMRGNRTIKDDNINLDAFHSPNFSNLIELGVTAKVRWDLILEPPIENFNLFNDLNNNISIIKFFPIMKDEIFEAFFKYPIQAVVIETYGGGNMPNDRPRILEILKEACDRGVIVVNVSQCRTGLVSTTYELGYTLEKIGVIFVRDMIVECALAKLAYLLGKGYDTKTIKEIMQKSIRGEISELVREEFSLQSNSFINAVKSIVNTNKQDEESYTIAINLLPAIINHLVKKQNVSMLNHLKGELKEIYTNEDLVKKKSNPLHVSCQIGDLEITKFLINERISINQVDEDNMTPLNYACMNNFHEVALLVKKYGGIINQNSMLTTTFHDLAKKGDLDNIKLFLECGANVMTGNYDHRTIAHIAASEGKLEIIKFLTDTKNKINIMVEDRWGNTPYDEGTQQIKTYLENKRIKKVKMQTSISSSDKSEIKNLHQVINTNNNNTIITNNTTNNEESNDNNDNDL